MNKKSAQKQKRLETTASRKPLFHKTKANTPKPPKPNQKLPALGKPRAGLYFLTKSYDYSYVLQPIQTILNIGSSGIIIDIECQLSNGLPGITIVGLGSKAIDESRERVRSAFASSQIAMPRKRITINLAPADIPKESTSLDLAIALAILQADGQLRQPIEPKTAIIGELGLDGNTRPVRGIIGKILAGQKRGMERFFIPTANLSQAELVPNITIIPVKSLHQLLTKLNSGELELIKTGLGHALPGHSQSHTHSLSDVIGQQRAKRALEIAAAGGHNIFFNGPPGTGKSMLARALPSILPPLKREEMLEITQLHSLMSSDYEELITTRPFRSPHHSASHVAIVGGGNNLRPGEISLAHRGVLLFDEFPEFARSTIEALRQPLEDRSITVARAKETTTYPANFILVATANPCPCGFYGTTKSCVCTAQAIIKYRQKISGPIMDRIDLYTDVQEIEHERLLSAEKTEDDKSIKSRIAAAREIQAARYGSSTKLNGDMTNRDIKAKSHISSDAQELLNSAAKAMGLSARSYMRVIKVARTIADLAESDQISQQHIGEALQYRSQNLQTLD